MPTEPGAGTPPTAQPVRSVAKLTWRDAPAFLHAIAIGTAGGAVFAFFDMPLAWMIGAMLASSAAAIGGVTLRMDARLRTLMIIILGTMLGSAFSPEILARITRWPATLGALMVYIAIAGAMGFLIYRRVIGLGPRTAYFAAAPGGFNEMVLIGGAMGGDERTISLAHATRVFIVVMIIPFWFRFTGDYAAAARASSSVGLAAIPLQDLAILAGSAVAGLLLARFARIPAPHLTGPMVVSAVVHLIGWTEARPPAELVAIAQIVIGTAIGTRFAGLAFREIADAVRGAIVVTAVMMALSVLLAALMIPLTGFAFPPLLLALAPGGLAEMSLVALALDIDAAFVATHHIARIAVIVIIAPFVFQLIERRLPD